MPCNDTLEERAVLFWSAAQTWRRHNLPSNEQKLLLNVLNDFDWTDYPRWQCRLDELKEEIDPYV
jgi:hypothetical protein